MRVRATILGSLAAPLLAAAVFAIDGAEGIERFVRVDERVAVGAQPTPAQVTALSAEGFNGIISLREESEFNDGPQSRAARDSGTRFVRVPVSSKKPADSAVEQFLKVTDDGDLYPVFIYCATANRAAALWMVRRVLRDGWTLADAESEAERAGLSSAVMRDFACDYIRRHAGKKAGEP